MFNRLYIYVETPYMGVSKLDPICTTGKLLIISLTLENSFMNQRLLKFSLGICFVTIFSSTFAGGFQAWQQSGYSIGNNAAGAAARAEDGTTAYYNPAGLTRIKHQNAAISIIGKMDNHKFRGRVNPSTTISGYQNSGTIQGGTSRILPSVLYAAPISDKWGFGFSMSSPFENNIDYGRNAYSRYIVTKNQLFTLDLGPSIAYRILKQLSLGLGFDAQYLRFSYNQTDTTSNTTANDAINKNVLTDWAFGWNYGLLWEPTDNTRAGVSYRSRMNHHATGNSQYQNSRGRAKLHIELPPETIFSVYHNFTPAFALMATAEYTHWRIMNRLVMSGVAGPNGTSNITLADKMRNTWQFILGGSYKLNDEFSMRAGAGYDQSPIKNHARNLIIPDSNRYLASLGLGYQINKTMSVDLGYTHAFYQHKIVNHTATYGNETLTTLGSLYNSTDYVGLQFNWQMT